MLVEEDVQGYHSMALVRAYLAQGLHHGHKLVVASADQAPQDVLQVKHYCYTEKHEYDMDTSI